MNTPYRNPERRYRAAETWRPDEQKFQVVVEETDLWITVPRRFDGQTARDTALAAIRRARGDIRLWSELCPPFRHSLSPLPAGTLPDRAPALVRAMADAAARMGVGPFAAVAGAVAQEVAAELVAALTAADLPPEVMVENGGDTYLYSRRERVVALLTAPEGGDCIGLKLGPKDFPLSLCASSATIGHSLSFGRGDLAVVRAASGSLADAAATAYGNMLKNAHDVHRVLRQAERDAVHGVDGVYAQCDGAIGLWGRMELAALAES